MSFKYIKKLKKKKKTDFELFIIKRKIAMSVYGESLCIL